MAPELAMGEDDVRPVDSEHRATLSRHVVGHHRRELIAFYTGNHGQGDARIAAGWFQEDRVVGELATRLSLLDHLLGDAVFDAARRVCALELGENLHTSARAEALQLYQGCIADGVQYAVIEHRSTLIPLLSTCHGRQ